MFILNKYVTLSYLKSIVSVEIFKNETTTDSIHRRIVEVLHGLWSNSLGLQKSSETFNDELFKQGTSG